ncbi:MAG: hypothetical protein OIF55_18930 [Amphritea sp.]|nr:hypothetical protein [Amphritea sp.]
MKEATSHESENWPHDSENWPRDFDFRAEVAEQQELLQPIQTDEVKETSHEQN